MQVGIQEGGRNTRCGEIKIQGKIGGKRFYTSEGDKLY